MREISINSIENILIGNAEDLQAGTGATVIICKNGAPTGIDIRGGGPASRETPLLAPVAGADKIHAVVLSGGSAFGLDCSGGVLKYLEERDIGFDVGVTKVPLVCQSCIYDLVVGKAKVRPDSAMGYNACLNSEKNNPLQGCVGAGTGASVGKLYGIERAMKSGLGYFAIQTGDLKIGAVVCVNALGDIFDIDTHAQIAGLLSEDKKALISSEYEMYKNYSPVDNMFTSNTTIGAIITNANFNKTELTKIASMAHNGYARSINPVHTMADGDSIYAMSVGEIQADINMVGTLSARVMSLAITNAIKNATSMYNLPSYRDIV